MPTLKALLFALFLWILRLLLPVPLFVDAECSGLHICLTEQKIPSLIPGGDTDPCVRKSIQFKNLPNVFDTVGDLW